jgi:geranylgeranylglycerol-phosphate geranylgeranyltransferase
MNSRTFNAYIELLRPLNIGIVFLTIAAAAVIADARIADWLVVVLAALAGALIAGGGYALNDYFDLEIDRINRPSRPLPRGVASKEGVVWVWGATSAVGILLSAYLGSYTFAIATFWVVSLYFYNRTYKRTIFAGNVLVGVITGLAFVYGAVAVGNVERSWFPALFAFLINVARELVKDVEDLEGDAKENAQTLPVKYGIKPALMLASLTIILLVTATVLPYSSGMYTIEYLIIVALVNVALLYVVISMWMDRSPSNLKKLSLILKLNMILGLIAIFVGS